MQYDGDWLQLRKELQSELEVGFVTIRQFAERRGIEFQDRRLLGLVNVAVMHSFRNGEVFDIQSLISDFPNFSEAGLRATVSRARKIMAESYCPLTDIGIQTIDGNIDLQNELFRDSTGVVYSAISRELDQSLEVKLTFPCAGPIPEQLKTLQTIGHPGIYNLVKFGTVQNWDYLVQERPLGVTLKSLCKYPAKIGLLDAAEILIDILDAVDHCHCMGFVFRRIRPEHILIGKGNKPIISNFELALPFRSVTQEDSGDPGSQQEFVSPVADNMFKLGALFFEVLTGIAPFRFDSDGKYFRYPSEYRDEFDHELETICLNAISNVPSNQFKSARQFKQSFEIWSQGARRRGAEKSPHLFILKSDSTRQPR